MLHNFKTDHKSGIYKIDQDITIDGRVLYNAPKYNLYEGI